MNFEIDSLQDVRQTAAYADFIRVLGWQTSQIGTTRIFIKKLPLLPVSLIKVLRHRQPLALKTLGRLQRQHHALITKQEPFLVEKQHGSKVYFRVAKDNHWPLLPTKTLWLDLTYPETKILAKMKPKTRYNLKIATNNCLSAQVISGDRINSQQLVQFYQLWSSNKPHNWLFKPHFSELKSLIGAFGKKCFLVFIYLPCHSEVRHSVEPKNLAKRNICAPIKVGARSFAPLRMTENEVAACSLILISSNMAFYWHNASTNWGKKLFAPTLCIWETIREAKRRNMIIFDFEGVWDERFPQLNRGWQGFTRFKQGFSG